MGIIDLFMVFLRNGVTSGAFIKDLTKVNFNEIKEYNKLHWLLLDYNSIIHNSHQRVIKEINNAFKELIFVAFHNGRLLIDYYNNNKIDNSTLLSEKTKDFLKLHNLTFNFKQNQQLNNEFQLEIANSITVTFNNYFTQNKLNDLVIKETINDTLMIINKYGGGLLKFILIAMDGIPSERKMEEQSARRITSSIIETYSKLVIEEYNKEMLLESFLYFYETHKIVWNRGNISPGTIFMNNLSHYLKSDNIKKLFMKDNKYLQQIIVSDIYEVGEGEKKIMNYIINNLKGTNDTVMVYSPDADVVLLCILLPVDNVLLLKYESNFDTYSIVKIATLRENIAYYCRNISGINFNTREISNDIVFMSTIFGNDFVPKIETVNVTNNFHSILNSYISTLIEFNSSFRNNQSNQTKKIQYLIDVTVNSNNTLQHSINYDFFVSFLNKLAPIENDRIVNSQLYENYKTAGNLKYVFEGMNITIENIERVFREFNEKYLNLKMIISQNSNINDFPREIYDDLYIKRLKRAIVLTDKTGNTINSELLDRRTLFKLIKDFFNASAKKINDNQKAKKKLPPLNINIYSYKDTSFDRDSRSKHWQRKIKEDGISTQYGFEMFKFENMLDEYSIILRAEFFTADSVQEFENDFFKEGAKNWDEICNNYVQGLTWVLDYYSDNQLYLNTWHYKYKRAPFIYRILNYMKSIQKKGLQQIKESINQFYDIQSFTRKYNLQNYFTPLSQLIFVSPPTELFISILPIEYRNFVINYRDSFIKAGIYVNYEEIAKLIMEAKKNIIQGKQFKSIELNCINVKYLNKCNITTRKDISNETIAEYLRLFNIYRSNTSRNSVYDYLNTTFIV